MASNIKLYGINVANVDTLPSSYSPETSGYGVGYSDVAYADLAERKSGFIPNTAASSLTLNAALRQNSFTSYILGQILGTPSLLDSSNPTISLDLTGLSLVNYADTQATRFKNFLNKINLLINGGQYARYARIANAYDPEALSDVTVGSKTYPSISKQFNELNTLVTDIQRDVEDGDIVAQTAKNYVAGGTIASKFDDFNKRITALEYTTEGDYSVGSGKYNNVFDKTVRAYMTDKIIEFRKQGQSATFSLVVSLSNVPATQIAQNIIKPGTVLFNIPSAYRYAANSNGIGSFLWMQVTSDQTVGSEIILLDILSNGNVVIASPSGNTYKNPVRYIQLSKSTIYTNTNITFQALCVLGKLGS